MIASTQIKKPEHWQDFEKLCKKLWGEIWDCPNTIKRNGRSGQKQNGVDVYGIPKGETQYYGIQCKGKDEYTNSTLTYKEIDEEIQKAESFKPKLKCFIFASTANKDTDIEEYVRNKDIEYRTKGLFEVHLACWEDIVDLLEERRNTYNWYINNCQYKDNTDVAITFNGREEIEIYPEYIRTTIYYELDRLNTSNLNNKYPFHIVGMLNDINLSYNLTPNTDNKIQWYEIPIKIENTGTTVIEDYKLYFSTKKESVECISTGIEYLSDVFLDSSFRMEMNRQIDEDRELYESADSENELVYIPNDTILVQTDRRLFSFNIGLKYGVDMIPIYWNFKSRNYNKKGLLKILVIPRYEEKTETRSCSDLRESEVFIEAKILEE